MFIERSTVARPRFGTRACPMSRFVIASNSRRHICIPQGAIPDHVVRRNCLFSCKRTIPSRSVTEEIRIPRARSILRTV
jgi:hypothetical protein